MKLKTLINNNKKQFDRKYKNLLLKKLDSSILSKAMFYGSINGGKRIRPFLVNQASKIANLKQSDAFLLGASIECIHSYSLIHDDLPCMDNDNMRRGKPSAHIKFGESTAVLAGNSLLTMAFEILTSSKLNLSDKIKVKLVDKLSTCSGHLGIAGGQYLDLDFEKKKVSKKQIVDMEIKKTGKLFSFCCAVPAIIKDKSVKEIKFFESVGSDIGLLFQIADDLIDFKGNSKIAGKKTKKDQKKGKATLISLLGYDASIKYCGKIISDINRNLKIYGSKSKKLNDTLEFILNRNK